MSSSFLDFMFFDSDWRQRQELDAISATAEGMADNLAHVGARMVALRTQVHELSVTVAVMMKMLGEAGALDATTLKYRVEAELEAIADARAQPSTSMLTCLQCKASVPAARTLMTADGVLCDTCAAGVRT